MAEKKKMSAKEGMARLKKFWSGPLTPNYYLGLKEVVAFSVSGLGVNFILNIGYIVLAASIIPIAYGVPAIHATIIGVVVSLLSLIVSPIFGKVIDGTKSKKGNKLKPHFLWITPVVTLFGLLASFSPQIENGTVKLVYLYCTAVPTLLLHQLFLSLFNLYPAVMTPNSQERANMLSPVSIIFSFAPTVMNILIGPMRDIFKAQNREYMAFRIFGIVFSLLGFALTFFIFRFTKERTYDTESNVEDAEAIIDGEATSDKKEKITFAKGLKMIFKNKPLLMYIVFTIFGVLKTTFFLQAQLIGEYKYQSDYGTSIFSLLTAVTGFGATPGMLLAPIIIKKIGKKNVLIVGTAIQTVILVLLACVGFQNMPVGWVTIVICTLYGFLYNLCVGLNIITMPAIMADLIDYQQYISNVRIEGFINAANLWVSALFGVVFQFIPVLIQTKVIGFEPGLSVFRPSPSSIASGVFNPAYVVDIANRWFNAAVYIALAACVLSLIPMFFYKFSEKEHKKCMEEIKLRAVSSSFEDEENLAEAKAEAFEDLKEEGVNVDETEIVESRTELDNEVTAEESAEVADTDVDDVVVAAEPVEPAVEQLADESSSIVEEPTVEDDKCQD